MCSSDLRPFDVELRCADKIQFLTPTGCWLWTGQTTSWGYGVTVGLEPQRKTSAHRAVWEALVGPIPEGMELDHTCRTRLCVNPAHLQVTTHGENTALGQTRKTHCPSGHPYDEVNTYRTPQGHRQCRTCKSVRV
jgi:HNH endonuclease